MLDIRDFRVSERTIMNILSAVYGVGRTKSLLICKRFGVSHQTAAKDIHLSRLIAIKDYLETKVPIGDDVKKVEADTIRRYITNTSIKGRRVRRGLPIRGQRTRTNAQTPKRRKSYFEQFAK